MLNAVASQRHGVQNISNVVRKNSSGKYLKTICNDHYKGHKEFIEQSLSSKFFKIIYAIF